jgi:hypothetical protein
MEEQTPVETDHARIMRLYEEMEAETNAWIEENKDRGEAMNKARAMRLEMDGLYDDLIFFKRECQIAQKKFSTFSIQRNILEAMPYEDLTHRCKKYIKIVHDIIEEKKKVLIKHICDSDQYDIKTNCPELFYPVGYDGLCHTVFSKEEFLKAYSELMAEKN